MRTLLAAVFSLFLLTACDTTLSLKELRNAPPAADAYQAALAHGYREFAEIKEANYDWWASKYFADKGLMAAYGREIQPEDPATWDIAPTVMPEFTDARAKLMAAISANRASQPDLTAEAVVAYDRWVEIQNNGWDLAGIETRRDAFFAALAALAAPSDGSALSAVQQAVESTSTILYFPFDSDRLDGNAQAAFKQLVHDLKTGGNISVSINGHADRAGTEEYNLELSQRRAKYIMNALIAAGVSPKTLHYFAFGDSDPAVQTEPGVREPRNRRVEIFIE